VFEIQAWRQQLVLERQDGFDQTGDARCAIQMPNVGLDRAECAELLFLRAFAKRLDAGR